MTNGIVFGGGVIEPAPEPIPFPEEPMATEEGWDDFKLLVEKWQAVYNLIAAVKAECSALAALKVELIDDHDRKAAMTPIGNQYPDHNMNSICRDVDRMIAASAVLTARGY